MGKGFQGPKHDQGTRKPGEVGPKQVYKDNTVTSKKGGVSADTLGAQEFIDDHEIERIADRNGNDDKLFKASNIETTIMNPKEKRHGYSAKKSADVNEKVLTFAEKNKREDIAQAIERDHPEYSMEKKMAIATAQAKKVAEDVEQVDDILEAVLAEQDDQEVEAITTMLEAMYESLEDDQSREQFIDMLESDEKFEQLLDTVQNILAEETQDE